MTINIESYSFQEARDYFDKVLNPDKTSYRSSNDEPTPIDCIVDMMKSIPTEFWSRKDLKILDPCCGNGNFGMVMFHELMKQTNSTTMDTLNSLYFNDTNQDRLDNVSDFFCGSKTKLNITNHDFLEQEYDEKFDLVVANPPYAKLQKDGKRSSKNHNLIKDFIDKSLSVLKPNGYLLFLTPNNWMSCADRNTLIKKLTKLQILHLDIHSAKKYFKKIGSSFTWYLIQNCPSFQNINITGLWKKQSYTSSVLSQERDYIPLLYNQMVQSILTKTLDCDKYEKFQVKTSSDLHKYTKKIFTALVHSIQQ